MKKKDIIWREILYQVIKKKKFQFTQKELAEKFGISLSTVFSSLRIPRRLNSIEVTGRYFRVRNPEKFLYLWATERNLGKDIFYSTHYEGNVFEIEGLMPENIIYAAYSAFRKSFGTVPADYDRVYVYSEEMEEIKKRFPLQKGYQNITVLKTDSFLKLYGSFSPLPQTFVDIWNLPEWYAQDFYLDLKRRIDGLLA